MVESVGIHGGDYLIALWEVLGYMMGVLSYMVESVRLHGVLLGYMVGCWVTWWELLGYMVVVLGYMVGCWVTW